MSKRNAATTTSSWSRNYNTVRHAQKNLGPWAYTFLVAATVTMIGLIYVSQSTQATNYDYELSAIDSEIADLQAKKEDLAVEKARLTSIASAQDSEVAANMENATPSGYVKD